MRLVAGPSRGVAAAIAMLALSGLAACSVEASEDAHELAEKFAGGPTEGQPAAAKTAGEAARATADEARKRADAKRREAARLKADAARRAAAQRRADEADMLARAAAEAEERRAAQAEARAAAERADAAAIAAEAAMVTAEEQSRRLAEAAANEAARKQQVQAKADAEEATRRAEAARRDAEFKRAAEIAAAEAAQRAEAEKQRMQAAIRLAEEKAEEERRAAEAAERAEAQRAEAEAKIKSVEREAELARLAEKIKRAQQQKEASGAPPALPDPAARTEASTPKATPPQQPSAAAEASGKSSAALSALAMPPRTGTAAAVPDDRVAVIMVLKPGSRGIRRFEKTADPLLCVSGGCYVSSGADRPAEFRPGRRALGFAGTWGERAGACSHSLGCVFRQVDLKATGGWLQPVDLRVLHHDRREQQKVVGDSECHPQGPSLTCRRPLVGPDYRMWIVPERLVDSVGVVALEGLLTTALIETR